MQIHVVSQGGSLFSIANTYSTSMQNIIDANELDAPDNLVVGQALVIPIVGQFYFVQPGDSLFSIGQRFGIPYTTLAQVNNIPVNQVLQPGLRLYIPQPQTIPPTTLIAYVEPIVDTVS